jgi:hypothetical protein
MIEHLCFLLVRNGVKHRPRHTVDNMQGLKEMREKPGTVNIIKTYTANDETAH